MGKGHQDRCPYTIHIPSNLLHICTDNPTEDAPPGTYTVDTILNERFPSRVQDRFDRALLNLCALTEYPGYKVIWHPETDFTLLMAETVEAGWFMLRQLEEYGLIKTPQDQRGVTQGVGITVLGKGFNRATEIENPLGREQSKQAFVAMSFRPDLNEVYEKGIATAITECGFQPHRVDDKEFNDDITDEIVTEIKRSKFVVCDVTYQSNGAYWEAGYAKGLGLPVIWMCRENEMHKLHFDTRQNSHILWTDQEHLRKRLVSRIRATIPGANLR